MPGAILTPRPMPERRMPIMLGGAVVALALPVFLLAGWDVRGWALGALLWAGSQIVGMLLNKAGIGEPTLRGSGVAAFGMMSRGIVLVLILIAVAVADPSLALAGALTYAAAYSVELAASLTLYFQGSAAPMSFVFAAEGDFDPQHEFLLEEWIPIQIGPLDMSVNKAVVYLWVGGLATIFLGIWLMRFGLSLKPDRRQTAGEAIYELVQSQIAESSLPSKALRLWFPYVASLFLFIWVVNIVGFLPLPISNDTYEVFGVNVPTLGIYAATANLSVTLALALITFAATHVEGIRYNGVPRYLKSWIPAGAEAASRADRPARGHLAVQAAHLALRPTLRQHARGPHADPRHARPHLHLLVWFPDPHLGPPPGRHLPLRGGIVVTIQAFVFALLSAIYIGAAIEPEH